MNEYIIVGDKEILYKDNDICEYEFEDETEEYEGCLVCLCGTSLQKAKEILHQMLNNPTDNDRRLMQDLNNFRIKEVSEKDCWWNYNCD